MYDARPGVRVLMTGCFTIERNIRGLTAREIEHKPAFRQGRLNQGFCMFVLDREPRPDEYVPLGSTFYPQGDRLRRLPKFRPGLKPLLVFVTILLLSMRAQAAERWT